MALSAPRKFLAVNAGIATQTQGATVGGSASAYEIPLCDVNGLLPLSFMPTGVGPDTSQMVASEALSAGAMVNVWSNSGTQNARNADNSSTSKITTGVVIAAVASAGTATVYYSGILNGLSGLTPGATYFLGAAGAITLAPPTSSGTVTQIVGTAISATQLQFAPQAQINN